MRTVLATTSAGLEVTNNVRTCAERRMLERLTRLGFARGVPPHRITRFVRRAVGWLVISRVTAEGEAACSLPCVLCRRRLDAFHLRWVARDWVGTVDNLSAGPSTFTQRQRNAFHGSYTAS